MNSDITKKQHYVWRHYLKAWNCSTDDKVIWTGLLKQNQVKKLGLMDVAQSSFFYKLAEIDDKELGFLKQFTTILPPGSKSIAELLLTGYMMFTQLKKDMASGRVKTNQDFEHKVNKIEKDTFESIQSHIESMGKKLIKCESIADIEDLAKKDEYEFLYYMWVQYMRTKTMKDRVGSSMEEKKWLQVLNNKCWPFFNLVMAMRMVEDMVVKKDYRFVFIKNNTEIPFITGDQPVINAVGDVTDEEGFAKELEVFYPMSPTKALSIAFNEGDKYSNVNADVLFVTSMNRKIMDESLLHIFANEEFVLKDLMGVV